MPSEVSNPTMFQAFSLSCLLCPSTKCPGPPAHTPLSLPTSYTWIHKNDNINQSTERRKQRHVLPAGIEGVNSLPYSSRACLRFTHQSLEHKQGSTPAHLSEHPQENLALYITTQCLQKICATKAFFKANGWYFGGQVSLPHLLWTEGWKPKRMILKELINLQPFSC